MAGPVAALQPNSEPAHAPRWNQTAALALIAFARSINAEGLNPAHYDIAPLEAALTSGNENELHAASASLFGEIAADLALGAAPPAARLRWRIEGAAADLDLDNLTYAALAQNDVAGTLARLSPSHPQFVALRNALAQEGLKESARKGVLANMERWRWMPRDLGESYVIVNVPALELQIVRKGREVARHRIIAGARKTPTPQFQAMATDVVFNPTWFVPASIAESEGINSLLRRNPAEADRRGYYVEDGSVRQKPGANNPLGRMKLVMPNPFSVLLHDTSTPARFNREDRFLSHGCIRVEGALDFAAELLRPDLSREAVDEFAASGITRKVELGEPIRIYVAYFTVVADGEGVLSHYRDIYGLDRLIGQSPPERTADAETIASAKPAIDSCLSEAIR